MHTDQHRQHKTSNAERRYLATWIMSALLVVPCTTHANAGTPLMWAGALHLVIGNAVIGLIEAAILVWLLRARFWKAALVMVLGNYVAWWSFEILLPSLESSVTAFLGTNPLLNVKTVIAGLFIAAFLFSLVIEAPFSYLAACVPWARRGTTKPSPVRFGLSHFLAQSVTYVLLVSWYTSASTTSLLRIKIQPELLRQVPNGRVRFTNNEGKVAQVPLRGGTVEILNDDSLHDTRGEFNPARSLDPTSAWTVYTDDWSTSLVAKHKNGTMLDVALNTPVVDWSADYASVLPGGYVVYQLGTQIVVLDMNKRAMAPLVAGTEPYVILDE